MTWASFLAEWSKSISSEQGMILTIGMQLSFLIGIGFGCIMWRKR